MTQAAPEDRYGRGHRFKGKGRQEDTPVFTLDEWEKRKSAGLKSTAQSYIDDTSRDEELARQLQEQLDLEDSYVGSTSLIRTPLCFKTSITAIPRMLNSHGIVLFCRECQRVQTQIVCGWACSASAVLKKREAGEEIFEGEDGGEEGAEDEGEAGEDFSPIQTSNGSGNSSCGRPSHVLSSGSLQMMLS